jgi:hypothetical protein
MSVELTRPEADMLSACLSFFYILIEDGVWLLLVCSVLSFAAGRALSETEIICCNYAQEV